MLLDTEKGKVGLHGGNFDRAVILDGVHWLHRLYKLTLATAEELTRNRISTEEFPKSG